MKKWLFLFPLALLAVSCIHIDDLSYDGVESVQVRSVGASNSAVDVFVNASNASGTAVKVVRAELTLDRGDRTLLRASVDEKVKLPRKFEGTVRIPVKVRIEGGMFGALGMLGSLAQGTRGTTVSGIVVVHAGLARKKLEVKNMDTDRFLRQFGVNLSDIVKGYGL